MVGVYRGVSLHAARSEAVLLHRRTSLGGRTSSGVLQRKTSLVHSVELQYVPAACWHLFIAPLLHLLNPMRPALPEMSYMQASA